MHQLKVLMIEEIYLVNFLLAGISEEFAHLITLERL